MVTGSPLRERVHSLAQQGLDLRLHLGLQRLDVDAGAIGGAGQVGRHRDDRQPRVQGQRELGCLGQRPGGDLRGVESDENVAVHGGSGR